jgi:hypothetical protein
MIKPLYALHDKNDDFARSWSNAAKIPIFRTKKAAKDNMKHYRGEDLRIVKYTPEK